MSQVVNLDTERAAVLASLEKRGDLQRPSPAEQAATAFYGSSPLPSEVRVGDCTLRAEDVPPRDAVIAANRARAEHNRRAFDAEIRRRQSVPWRFRLATAGECVEFVASHWMASYFSFWPPRPYFADGGKLHAMGVYRAAHCPIVDAILRRAVVVVAYDADVPRVLHGFVVFEGATLHYVYVVKTMRRSGIARALLEEARGVRWCSHMTSRGAKIAREMRLRYKPERRFERRDDGDQGMDGVV